MAPCSTEYDISKVYGSIDRETAWKTSLWFRGGTVKVVQYQCDMHICTPAQAVTSMSGIVLHELQWWARWSVWQWDLIQTGWGVFARAIYMYRISHERDTSTGPWVRSTSSPPHGWATKWFDHSVPTFLLILHNINTNFTIVWACVHLVGPYFMTITLLFALEQVIRYLLGHSGDCTPYPDARLAFGFESECQ